MVRALRVRPQQGVKCFALGTSLMWGSWLRRRDVPPVLLHDDQTVQIGFLLAVLQYLCQHEGPEHPPGQETILQTVHSCPL